MKTVFFVLLSICIYSMYSCCSDDEHEYMFDGQSQCVLTTDLQSQNMLLKRDEDYCRIATDVTDAFGSKAPELVEKVRDGKLIDMIVFAKEKTFEPHDEGELRRLLRENSSNFNLLLDGNRLILVSNERERETFSYTLVYILYDCSSPAYAEFQVYNTGESFLRSCPSDVIMDDVNIYVILATDFVTAWDGYMNIYESSGVSAEDLNFEIVSESWYNSVPLYP